MWLCKWTLRADLDCLSDLEFIRPRVSKISRFNLFSRGVLTFRVVPCAAASPTSKRRSSAAGGRPVTGTSEWCPPDSRPRQPTPVAGGADRGPASRRSSSAPAPIRSTAAPTGRGRSGSGRWPASRAKRRSDSEDRHLQFQQGSFLISVKDVSRGRQGFSIYLFLSWNYSFWESCQLRFFYESFQLFFSFSIKQNYNSH